MVDRLLTWIKQNKGFWILYFIQLALMLTDLFLTWSFGAEMLQYLETNPVYKFAGLIGIFGLNMIILGVLIWNYNRSHAGVGMRFFMMQTLVVLIAGRIFAIRNALHWRSADLSVQEVAAIVTPEAVVQTQLMLAFIMYVPFIINFLTYLFYKMDHNIYRKNNSFVRYKDD